MRGLASAGLTAFLLMLAAGPAGAAAPIYVAGDLTGDVDVFDGGGARLTSFDGGFTGADRLAVGDVTGDGEDEVLIAGDGTGTVDIFDQGGLRPVPSFDGDYSIADGFAVGNVTGDARDEILVAGDVSGRVDVFDASGTKLNSFYGDFTTSDGFAAGDVTAGGFDEILIAGDATGTIDVFSAAGTKLTSFDGDYTNGDGFAVGNVTGGGKEEILVAGDAGGRVDVFDAGGTKLTSFDGNFSALDALASGDVSGDGLDEIVIAGDVTGSVDVFDAAGTKLASFGGNYTSGDGFAVGRHGEFDIDRDSLLDRWETVGIDVNADGNVDLDLPALGASPGRKDLFIEADFMALHMPRADAINDVVTGFANAATVTNPNGTTGITLRVDVDEQVAHQNDISTWGGFDAIKDAAFGTPAQRASSNAANILAAKRLVYHYALYAHTRDGGGSSGIAELGGNDFVVSLGGSGWGRDASMHNVGTRNQQAGTLMHEFGHNLGLEHGGGDSTNCEPNYVSIMSYAFQTSGISRAGVPGVRFDFSSVDLAELREGSLSEPAGIGDGPDFTAWSNGMGGRLSSAGNVPLDWDADGGIDAAAVSADINNLNITDCKESPRQTLTGFDDWRSIDFNFRDDGDFADGAHSPSPPEITAADAQVIERHWDDFFSPDLEVTKTVDRAEAIPGDKLTYTVTIKNVGPGAATDVELVDTFPGGSTQTRTIGTLAAGASATETFTYTVPFPIADGTTLTNTASVVGENLRAEAEENLANNSDGADTIVHTPVLELDKDATATTAAGATITWTLTYANSGGAAAEDVTVTDTLPAGVYYSEALDEGAGPKPDSVTANADGTTTLRWSIGSLPAHSSPSTIEYTARSGLLSLGGDVLTNDAEVDFSDANGNDYPAVEAAASSTVVVVAASRDPRGKGFWRSHESLWTSEILARIQATDQRFDTGADGTLTPAEVAAALAPGGNQPTALEQQLLAVYFNLATRRVNAGTVLSSRLSDRLGLGNVKEAVQYATATLALPVTSDTRARYSDATAVLEAINENVSPRY